MYLVLTHSSNLNPGGYIEHIDTEVGVACDDGTMPADSLLASMGEIITACSERSGRPIDCLPNMTERIKGAGFVNIKEKKYKVPLGSWPKHPLFKDAGRIGMVTYKAGIEGFVMYLSTMFGHPEPWTEDRTREYINGLKKELDSKSHVYQNMKRVWAQKPYDAEPTEA